MRIIALLATYNEERFIVTCLEHYIQHGVDVYLIDHESTDATVRLAKPFLGQGLVGIETFPNDGIFRAQGILERKEALAASLDADWFMHIDADERFVSPRAGETLGEALTRLDLEGYNAVNFLELTFVPTVEAPDHDHPRFEETMRWYYAFQPAPWHGMRAWKKQAGPVGLSNSGGHRLNFLRLRLSPEQLYFRHYQFLSLGHVAAKYGHRKYEPAGAVPPGWHGWRRRFNPAAVELPRQSELREYTSDDQLDPSNPRREHILAQAVWPSDKPTEPADMAQARLSPRVAELERAPATKQQEFQAQQQTLAELRAQLEAHGTALANLERQVAVANQAAAAARQELATLQQTKIVRGAYAYWRWRTALRRMFKSPTRAQPD